MRLDELFDPVLVESESKLRQALKLWHDKVSQAKDPLGYISSLSFVLRTETRKSGVRSRTSYSADEPPKRVVRKTMIVADLVKRFGPAITADFLDGGLSGDAVRSTPSKTPGLTNVVFLEIDKDAWKKAGIDLPLLQRALKVHAGAVYRDRDFVFMAPQKDEAGNPIPGDAAERTIRLIKSYDPTPQGTYTLWMIDRWLKGTYRLEDLPRIQNYLDIFNRKRASIEQKDIERYATPQDVLAVIRPFLGIANGAASEEKMQEMLDPSHTTLLLDNAEWRVVMPHTVESAGFWGGNTEWCIAWGVPGSRYPARDENYFNEYMEDGPFILIHDKAKNTDWALHLAGGSPTLWDADDMQHDAIEAMMQKPGWLTEEVRAVIGKVLPTEMALLDNPTDDMVERILIENPKLIRYVANPSATVQAAVLSRSPDHIQYIQKPDMAVVRHVAENHPYIVAFMKDPPEDLMLKAVETRPDIIVNLLTATERVQLRAMQIDGMMLGHIMPNLRPFDGRLPMPSRVVIETAIRNAPGAIAYVEEPDEALQLLAVSREGQYLASIRAKQISPKVAATAVRNSKRFAIHHVMTNSNCGPEAKAAGYLAMKEADPAFARDSLERYPDAAKAIRRVLGDQI